MTDSIHRRTFLKSLALAGPSLAMTGCLKLPHYQAPQFKISLAEWSLHRSIFGAGLDRNNWGAWEHALKTDPRSVLQGPLDHLDFARTARQVYGIGAVEYVNVFFYGRGADKKYLNEMKTRAGGEGVQSLLIMCDHEGALGDPDIQMRRTAVENHFKWVEAAKFLGCHSIRVNAGSVGSYDEQQKLVADGLNQLAEFAQGFKINVIVENHGGLTSNGAWLAGVMQLANHANLGTLPDFGNFHISDTEQYDVYTGVTELMPYARGVSAKAIDFDAQGNETHLDYSRLIKIVLDSGYHGYLGIEYEGDRLTEHQGILATRDLLNKFL
ncbi:MAG: TIM barrel protein [Candidatus Marinimicrobia bacterium]|nr:TIM barrel protein [Candidatus Neomarinimicrobiota bacterium]